MNATSQTVRNWTRTTAVLMTTTATHQSGERMKRALTAISTHCMTNNAAGLTSGRESMS